MRRAVGTPPDDHVQLDALTMIAFARWSVYLGMASPAKAEAYLELMKKQFRERGIAWPEESAK